MTEFELVIRGGTVVTSEGMELADIGISHGKIATLKAPDAAAPLHGRRIIDAAGKHVLPGVIDCHVHFRQPGPDYKEDWATGTEAAAFGGVTTVLEMPNTSPPTDSVERFLAKKALAESQAYVDFGLYGLVADSSIGSLAQMHEAGVIGFKCFLSHANAEIPMIDDGTLLEAFETLSALGARCVVHAENGAIIENRTARLKSAGRTDPVAHADSRPEICAIEAVSRVIAFAEWTGGPIHIAHEGSAAALDLISAAKARGVAVTVETCPQYLLLSQDDLEKQGGILRCNPPLRDKSNQERLWSAIRQGTIDILATDHAPHTPEEKLDRNIWGCQCGMLGVETALPLMLTEVAAGRIDLTDYVRISAANPAKIWGLYPQKGTIRIGSDADIAIVDLAASGEIDQRRLHSKSKISAWHGRKVRGLLCHTLVRGRIVIDDGILVGECGWGRHVTPLRDLSTVCRAGAQ